MVNRRRGEVAATIAGERYRLCLTLGSLAELEHGFGVSDLNALASRFASGHLAARDLVLLLGAGLRGGGHPISDAEVEAMPIAGELAGIAAALAQLLEATFGGPGEGGRGRLADPPPPQPA